MLPPVNIKTASEGLIEKLHHLYYWKTVNYANYFLKDLETSKEMAQEAMISLWLKRDQLDTTGNIEYYLLSTVRNKALNLLKHRRRVAAKMGHKISVTDKLAEIALSDSPADTVIFSELSATIDKTIDGMNQHIKTTFLLCREQGLSYKEIAKELNISVKTVEYRISRALEILRSALGEYFLLLFILFFFLG